MSITRAFTYNPPPNPLIVGVGVNELVGVTVGVLVTVGVGVEVTPNVAVGVGVTLIHEFQ